MANFSVGIVGLDSMGAALARRLDEQGIGCTATDLNGRMLQAHLASGGSAPAGSPYDLAQVCDLVLIAETSDATLREAVLGSIGLVHKLRPGTIIVDMSDASPQTGPELARALYSKGAIWLEATPVGGPQDAREGKLTLLTSGSSDALERIAPVLRAFASTTLRLGELGSGPLAKSIVATLGALSVAIHTEMMIVAKKAGLDPAGILGAMPLLAPGMGTPPVAVAAEVLSGRYQSGVANRRMQADIARVLEAAREATAPAPLASLVQAAYTGASHSPHATGDHMDAARWMADNAGVEFG
ncbi:MAG: NAD(P)-dependent oxidoreductase [Betaproteobacteria bacterium]|nr:NAD(P)-dependent oxidoreductase [Pseudolabrys sp.]MSQ73949.1 NAD(P)-dependent oxidoreductase [Betaproteobacteria bacterium]